MMETMTIRIANEHPDQVVNGYEDAGWAVRQIVTLSSVWWIVVLERPRPSESVITFGTPAPKTFDS